MVDLKYTWTIRAAQLANEGGLEKVVKHVDWALSASDGTDRVVPPITKGLDLPEANAKTFIPYEKLSHDDMVDWVINSPAVDPDYEKALLAAEFIKRVPAAPAPRYSEPLPFENA